MNSPVLIGLAVAILLLLVWLLRRRTPAPTDAKAGQARHDALDTVQAWPPEATRVLTLPERKAFAMLNHALPDHMVLAQVPLARFMRVPTRNSYHEWMRRVGQICADLVVCDASSQVVAVIELRRPPGKDSERTRRRHQRMDRVLRKAGIRVIEWNEEALPHPNTVRQQVLPETATGAPTVAPLRPVPPAVAPATTAAAAAMATVPAMAATRPELSVIELDEVLDGYDRVADAEDFGLADPTPSTWFDDLDSGPTPLNAAKA